MKSNVASSFTWRARSARKIAEPLSTPTRMTGCPAKSRVISAPNSTIRFAISSREISTLSSAMAFHIKLKFGGSPCRHSFRRQNRGTGPHLEERSSMNLKGVQLTWLGHATFRIETPGGRPIIIDPWIMNNPACPPFEKNLKHVDVLLCTHGHGDHIGD